MSARHHRFGLGFLTGAALLALGATALAASAVVVETVSDAQADKVVGTQATGDNWKVQSPVHSDGFMHLFALETPYGNYQVSGDKLLAERLNELHAVAVLEKMSKTKAF